MQARKTVRLVLLGAVMLTGCNLKLDPSILPVMPVVKPTPLEVDRPPSATPSSSIAIASACDRSGPAVSPTSGSARHGAFNQQLLPGGWDSLEGEQEVIAAINREEGGGNWACFQKFYPGATTVYRAKGSIAVRPIRTPSPRPMVSRPPNWFPPPPPPCRPADQSQLSLSGTVFDEQGVPFPDGVEVRVSTRGFAFNTTVQVSDGRYYVYGAPAGQKLEITAVHQASGEARRRFVTPQTVYDACGPQGFGVVNFGGPKSADDALGHRYPLPQVESRPQQTEAVVSGRVYDIAGNALDGVSIVVTSLLSDRPFSAKVASQGGAYVVNGVPAGVPVEIRVEHPGYSARARADVFFAGEGGRKGNVVNFGGLPTLEDPHAPQYALAPVPPEELTRGVMVKGLVETIDGKSVTLGVVHARSLEPEVPFEAKAEIGSDGAYHFDAIPAGVEIEFTLEAPGYEPIYRYERLWLEGGVYINFGGGSGQEDPEGESYALVETIVWDD